MFFILGHTMQCNIMQLYIEDCADLDNESPFYNLTFLSSLTFERFLGSFPYDNLFAVLPPPRDPGYRMSLGLARQRRILSFLYRHIWWCPYILYVWGNWNNYKITQDVFKQVFIHTENYYTGHPNNCQI